MIKINLRSILKEKEMTITQLHKITGISLRGLSALQNQKTDGIQFKTLSKICSALDIDLNDLMVYEEQFNISLRIDSKIIDNNILNCQLKIYLDGTIYTIYFRLLKIHQYFYEVDNMDVEDLPLEIKNIFKYENQSNISNTLYDEIDIYEVLSYLIASELLSRMIESSHETDEIFKLRSILLDFGNIIPRCIESKTNYNVTMFEDFESAHYYTKRFYEIPMTKNNQIPHNQILSNRLVNRVVLKDNKIDYMELIKTRLYR